MATGDLRKDIRRLLASQKLGVVATQSDGHPYGSLMAFAETEDLTRIYLATPRTTRKFENLMANHSAAIVIDNRSNAEEDFHEAMAVTATGTVAVMDPTRDEACWRLYLNRHPYLEDFVRAPTCALLQLRVQSYYLVSHFQKVMVLDVAEEAPQ